MRSLSWLQLTKPATMLLLSDGFSIAKVKSMQRSGTEAISTQHQLSKPKREIIIVKIQREHMINRVSSVFPKGGHSATKTELKLELFFYKNQMAPPFRNQKSKRQCIKLLAEIMLIFKRQSSSYPVKISC